MPDTETELAALKAQAAKLEKELYKKHRENGYQLGASDINSLLRMIQRTLDDGDPDALAQLIAIRTAYEIHGKVSYEQMKLLKEVSQVMEDADAFEAYKLSAGIQ